MFQYVGLDFDVLKKQVQICDFKLVMLKGEIFLVKFNVDVLVIILQNILGRVKGSQCLDEMVFYSVYWDYLGVGEFDVIGDCIYNGVVDNVIGIVVLFVLGKVFVYGLKFECLVVFFNVIVEEKGLFGLEYYVIYLFYFEVKMVVVINMDVMDLYGLVCNFIIFGSVKFGLFDDLIVVVKVDGVSYVVDLYLEVGYFFCFDYFFFVKCGVLVILFGLGDDWVDGGVVVGDVVDKVYIKDYYYQLFDQWQVDWSFIGMVYDLGMFYMLGLKLVNFYEWLNWSCDFEFCVVCDVSVDQCK